jgi:hypothetical protein
VFGWQEQTAAVASVYNSLPAAERARAAVFAYNYGEAGAIDYFGGRYGLPKAISGHNQYGLWGPRNYSGEVVVAIGFTETRLRQFFAEVTPAASVSPRYAMPEETNLTIFVCRRPRLSFQETWANWKYLN